MGVIQGSLFSDALGMNISYTAILPEQVEGPYPTLYLLHGYSDDDHAWLYNTSLVRYASTQKLAIFMPQVHLSFYANMKYGNQYWDFINEEFPKKMDRIFNISDRTEERFVAGLSMGGYGAYKLALNAPENWRGAASLSGVVDLVSLWKTDSSNDVRLSHIFGSLEELQESNNDLVYLLEKLAEKHKKPAFFQSCGTEDFLYENNRGFHHKMENAGLDYTYIEEAGEHNWIFWDNQIQKVLTWIEDLQKNEWV